MRLVSFSVTNYRSISSAHQLPISETTVLLGPNNEGKSNILNALATAIELIRGHARASLRQKYMLREIYDWERDFPVSMQEKKSNGESVFRVEFALTADEISEFRADVKSSLNGNLPIEIRIGRVEPQFKVLKKGPGGTALSKKGPKVAEFIGKRFDFTYIPAIRTAEEAMEVVSNMLASALRGIEEDPAYQEALARLSAIQQPTLNAISQQITSALKAFLPQVRRVAVTIPEAARSRAIRRSCEITIDDGTPTSLERKGDGVKSLAAISLLRGIKSRPASSLLALEEPESHLHPGAIHLLKSVLEDLAATTQVVLTTHCPVFVDRVDIGRNVLVTTSRARPAKRISEIREILGVRAADNLTHASFVLVVEGDHDRTALTSLLSHHSTTLRSALKQGALILDPIGGAGSLTYKLSLLDSALCKTHVFLDNDEAGRRAVEDGEKQGMLKKSDYTLSICNGMAISEFEDTFDAQAYGELFLREFNVDLQHTAFSGNKKWSDRLRSAFLSHGSPWDSKVENECKAKLAAWVAAYPGQALSTHKRSCFDALISKLERLLQPARSSVSEVANS